MTANNLSITPDELPITNSAIKTDVLIITKINGSNVNVHSISVNNLFGNTTDLSLKANNLQIMLANTPANSSSNVVGRTIWFDNNYLYIATSNNTIKRVSLESF